jgi:hypothetical protein|tara:strand:+ start:1196 stop:1324 length:129 start_codon:yes stop_codon:yes gene_type:complete
VKKALPFIPLPKNKPEFVLCWWQKKIKENKAAPFIWHNIPQD